jgi:GMP synthase (glutamine-hydrolysing)
MLETIVILDCDQLLSGLIARTLRSQDFYCELMPPETILDDLKGKNLKGVIIAAENGGTIGALDASLLHAQSPVLALGAAAVAICELLGGEARALEGDAESITLDLSDSPLFDGISGGERVIKDLCDLTLPKDAQTIATATDCCIGFMARGNVYAVQYTIERNDPDSLRLLHNFAEKICGMEPVWDANYIIHEAVEDLRQKAGSGNVLCAVSGGIDSSAVCAQLAYMAVGERLTCLFVDTGLFRKNEPQEVAKAFQEIPGIHLKFFDAKDAFLKALEGVRTEAEKERITGSLLKQVFYEQLKNYPDVKTIVLGTNYNDALYGVATPVKPPASSAGAYVTVEPVRALFKSEVKRLGERLSMPRSIMDRQPFPAAGLASRILGAVTPQKLKMLRDCSAFMSEELIRAGQDKRLWQYYAALSDNPDSRQGYVVILRACQAGDGEAYAARLPYDLLERITERILREVPQVKRVVYDLTPSYHYSFLE